MAKRTTALSHLDERGAARMVDVGSKAITRREAVAEGFVIMRAGTCRAIMDGAVPKGEVLNTARIGGILAAKGTGALIPLCHPLPIESVSVDFQLPALPPLPPTTEDDGPVRLGIRARAAITGKTGVEMEALAAVTVAALTIYDMCKAIDKGMMIEGVRLVKKTGGRSG